MANILPPPPLKIPLVSSTGQVHPSWEKWFQFMYTRIGEAKALTNLELANLPALELGDLQADVGALQAAVAALTGGDLGLDQGRVL